MDKLRYILLLLITIAMVSCESWLDVNQNPDVPEEVPYEKLLPSGITSIAYVMGGKYQVLGALWSQHWTQSPGASQYTGIDSYDINSSTYDENQFGEIYSGALQNLEYVRMASLAEKEYNYYLIATVMECYIYQVMADLYNQIPFSEALKGDKGILEPVYELGYDIYDSLIVRLDVALSLDLDKDDLKNPEQLDLVFKGNMQNWIAFANTLKLKIYLRQSNVNPDKARSGITLLYDNKSDFLKTDVSLNVFSNESGRRNPLFDTEEYTLGGNNLILSNTLYSFLIDNGDLNRLDYLFNKPENGGAHKALAQGNYYAPEESPGINSGSYSKPVMYPDDPVYLMSLSEANLLQAEAIVKFGVEDYSMVKDLYDEAILESYLRVLGRDENDLSNNQILNIASSFINDVYSLPAEGADIEEFNESIGIQKWLCLSGIQNLETFFELNRTGYPKKSMVSADNPDYEPGELTISVNNVTSGKFPQRLVFPESEYANNRNTPAKKEVWEKIWWNINQD